LDRCKRIVGSSQFILKLLYLYSTIILKLLYLYSMLSLKLPYLYSTIILMFLYLYSMLCGCCIKLLYQVLAVPAQFERFSTQLIHMVLQGAYLSRFIGFQPLKISNGQMN
jgi:hypothetical protein